MDIADTSDIQEARKILGTVAENMSDAEIKDQIIKIKSLTESWLDEFERATFEGKTVNELVNELELTKVAKYRLPKSR